MPFLHRLSRSCLKLDMSLYVGIFLQAKSGTGKTCMFTVIVLESIKLDFRSRPTTRNPKPRPGNFGECHFVSRPTPAISHLAHTHPNAP